MARIEYRRVGEGGLLAQVGVREQVREREIAFILVTMGCRMMNAFSKFVLAVCFALLVSPGLFAQSDLGKISGFIKDPSGATIANAKVTVRNNTGIERQTTTNDSGYYVVTNVPPGLYTMTAEAPGFQKYETRDNKLDPAADLVIDAMLTVGSSSQTVEVSASTVQLQTESAAVQKLVTREQIDLLAFNANTWTRNTNALTAYVAPMKYNQFGYNLGGPFYIPGKFNTNKKKVFFYWGEEWVKYHFLESGSSVGSAGLLSVPTVKMRQGGFSELLTANPFYSTTKTINDPNTGTQFVASADPPAPNYSPPCTSAAGCPNVIPVNRLSPNGVGILNAWPIPNLTNFIGGNGNWFAAKLHTFDQRKDTAGVDVNLTEKQRLRFHAMNYAYLEYQPLDGNTDRTPKFFNRPNKTGSLNHTWTLNPRMVNEVPISASEDVVLIPVDTANFFDRAKACAQSTVPCSFNYPYIFPTGKLLPNRIPTVNLSNFSGLSGGPYPSHSAGPIYDISDSFTWVKQNHTLKVGALWERSGENDNDEINVQACPTCTNQQNGQFLFTDGRAGGTGVAGGNAALGLFGTDSRIRHRAYTIFRGNMWAGL